MHSVCDDDMFDATQSLSTHVYTRGNDSSQQQSDVETDKWNNQTIAKALIVFLQQNLPEETMINRFTMQLQHYR